MQKNRNLWVKVVFAAYVLWMLWLLFGQRWGQNGGSLNLKPLHTLKAFWWVLTHGGSRSMKIHAMVNLAGNVVMFVPLGVLVPVIWRKFSKFAVHIFVMAGIILAIELLQLVMGLGTCDIDDLILNLLGTTIGFGVFKLRKHIFCRGEA